MLLRKYMSLLGIGSAQIDLILQKEIYRPGEAVQGYFFIKGGTIEQKLKRIDCDLVMRDVAQGIEEIIDTATILSTTRIDSEASNQISFTFQLPENVPASNDHITYRFNTKLHFHKGVESMDQDFIQIV